MEINRARFGDSSGTTRRIMHSRGMPVPQLSFVLIRDLSNPIGKKLNAIVNLFI